MRKNIAFMCLLLVGSASVACQQSDDNSKLADSIESLSASVKEGKSPSQGTANGASEEALQAMKKSILTALEDSHSGLKKTFKNDIEEVSNDLNSVKSDVKSSGLTNDQLKAFSSKADSNAASIEGIKKQNEELVTTVNRMAKALETFDFSSIIDMSGKAGDLQGQVIKARAELAESQRQLKIANDANKAKDGEITTLKATIDSHKSGDISKNPEFMAMKKRNFALQEDHRKALEYQESQKLLIDKLNEEIRGLKEGKPVIKTPAKKVEPVFSYRVSHVQFHPDTQQYVVLGNHVSGNPPTLQSEAVIVDQDDNVICRIKIGSIFEADPSRKTAAQIGGETINAAISNAPIKGYRIIPARAISAEGR